MAGGYEAAGRANGLEVRESPAVALLRLGHTPQGHKRLGLGHRGVTGLQAIIGAARRDTGLAGELQRTGMCGSDTNA